MKHIEMKKERKIREIMKNKKIHTYLTQISMLNKLFLGESYEEKKEMEREIKKKINSYKQQDISKSLFNSILFISLYEAIEKLVISKLKCYYCKHEMSILYNNIREPYQWTLDRIDNFLGHNNNNVVICCLECNLKRRRINSDAFLFTKQLKIVKQE
jgi:hypothetical protein